MIDQKKLALIHIVKQELHLSDPEYRSILRAAAHVESSKDLTDTSFRALMDYFVRTKHYRRDRYSITLKQKLYIQDLFKKLAWSDDHAKNYLKKYFHKSALEWFSKKDASALIVALKHILEKRLPQ
jgi:hypothetical protein